MAEFGSGFSELLVVFGGSGDENPCTLFACYQGIWAQRRVRSRLVSSERRVCKLSVPLCSAHPTMEHAQVETDPAYVDTSVRRWQKLTGGSARHAASGRSFDDLAREAEVANAA